MSHSRILQTRTLASALLVIITLCSQPDASQAAPGLQLGRMADVAASNGRLAAQSVQPQAYLVLFDVTTSMSWNFAGQGTKHGRDIQCGPSSDPAIVRRYCG